MSGSSRPPAFANDDWLLQQQLRAEIEADSWRRLREILAAAASAPSPTPAAPVPSQAAAPAPPAPAPIQRRAPDVDLSAGGSAILKALVRFGLGVFGAYLAWIAAMDGGLGEFEIWLATGSGFLVFLAASMFDPFRQMVRVLAEWLKIALFGSLALGFVWALLQFAPGPT